MINPDSREHGNSPGKAAREAVRHRRNALERRQRHLIETTLTGNGIFCHLKAAREKGYKIVLHYVSLGSPDQARRRIKNREEMGGHSVQEEDLRRRFLRSHYNLPNAFQLMHEVFLYDNSFRGYAPRVFATFKDKTLWVSDDVPDWAAPAIETLITLSMPK